MLLLSYLLPILIHISVDIEVYVAIHNPSIFPLNFPHSSSWTSSSINSMSALYPSHLISTTSTNPWKWLDLLNSIAYFISTSITNYKVLVTRDVFYYVVCGITALDELNKKYCCVLHAFLSWNKSPSVFTFPNTIIITPWLLHSYHFNTSH